jgi:hypothetical protein
MALTGFTAAVVVVVSTAVAVAMAAAGTDNWSRFSK